jgi:alpha-glucosidase
VAQSWLRCEGEAPPLDRALGERRARAAVLLLLALPGSTYLYQGDELGLHEVGDLPADLLEDPIAARSGGRWKGRDGCRVPLPWAPDGPSLGFGPAAPRLPQPAWFADSAVSRQEEEPRSTLRLHREAVALRKGFPKVDAAWWEDDRSDEVLHFSRPGGWHSITNFGAVPVDLPAGRVILVSEPLAGDRLPPATTAWLMTSEGEDVGGKTWGREAGPDGLAALVGLSSDG